MTCNRDYAWRIRVIMRSWEMWDYVDPLEPSTQLSLKIRRKNMKIATCKLSWTPSVSDDVIKQFLKVSYVDGGDVVDGVLDPNVSEYSFDVPEKSSIVCVLVSSDGTNKSAPAILTETVPDLTPPVAPTNFKLEIVDVKDAPAEPAEV